jgi:hypothetical protein
MKWLDRKVRFIVNQLSTFIKKFIEDFRQLHDVTKIIVSCPLWIPLVVHIIIVAKNGGFYNG